MGGEQFTAGGQVMSMTLAQALAPYDPQKLWNSYNPGVTVSVSKRLARSVSAQVSYNLEREGGGYGAPFAGSPMAVAPETAVTKTTEISLRGCFARVGRYDPAAAGPWPSQGRLIAATARPLRTGRAPARHRDGPHESSISLCSIRRLSHVGGDSLGSSMNPARSWP